MTESLKQLAWYMNYECAIKPRNINGSVSDGVFLYHGEVWYDPINNAEQDREIEIKFEITTFWLREGLWQAACGKTGTHDGRGKTPSEARLNAAIAAIKE